MQRAQLPEVVDGLLQSLVKRDSGLPPEGFLGSGDVWLPPLGVILHCGLVHDLRGRVGNLILDQLGEICRQSEWSLIKMHKNKSTRKRFSAKLFASKK